MAQKGERACIFLVGVPLSAEDSTAACCTGTPRVACVSSDPHHTDTGSHAEPLTSKKLLPVDILQGSFGGAASNEPQGQTSGVIRLVTPTDRDQTPVHTKTDTHDTSVPKGIMKPGPMMSRGCPLIGHPSTHAPAVPRWCSSAAAHRDSWQADVSDSKLMSPPAGIAIGSNGGVCARASAGVPGRARKRDGV